MIIILLYWLFSIPVLAVLIAEGVTNKTNGLSQLSRSRWYQYVCLVAVIAIVGPFAWAGSICAVFHFMAAVTVFYDRVNGAIQGYKLTDPDGLIIIPAAIACVFIVRLAWRRIKFLLLQKDQAKPKDDLEK